MFNTKFLVPVEKNEIGLKILIKIIFISIKMNMIEMKIYFLSIRFSFLLIINSLLVFNK